MPARPVPLALVATLQRPSAVALAMIAACRPAPAPPSADEGTSTGTGGASDLVGTTFVVPDACQGSDECETDGLCVAPYDPGSDPPMGAAGCIEACIEVDDITRWCFDDQACCGDARCHAVDGLCEPRPGASSDDTGTTGSSTTGGSTGDGSSTTGGDASSSGSGSSGSSSSGSGSSGSSSSG